MSQANDPHVFPGSPPMMARPIAPTESACPLTEAHFQMLRQWAAAYRPVRKAARVAMGSAITILAVAALAVPFTMISPSLTDLAIIAGLGIIGYLEYAGARKMRVGDPAAASHLGWNQVIFLSLICLYCVSRMLDTSVDSYISPEARGQLSEVPELATQIESLVPTAVRGFYLLVILLSVAFQGGLAWYYFTRRRHLEALQQSTPAWIRHLFQEIGGA